MDIAQHTQDRVWAFGALDDLQNFLEDPDFEGNAGEEQVSIGRKRTDLRENKYRVVFLGAFNVGKSALINAFLGDEYLPTVLEECTTKITHILRGEEMTLAIRLAAPASSEELETLRGLLQVGGVGAHVPEAQDEGEVLIAFTTTAPKDLLKCLRALVTVNADEEFPHLRPLRDKFDEIVIRLPTDLLADDIALVDTPGVHSISETKERITQEIIPHCHLVVYLLDSQNAGSQHSRDFIENVVKQRNRKVFFVINKADQLNEDEIDLNGRRGPAKDLLRSLEGIVDRPELFFVSSLYALVAAQLQDGRIELENLDRNNKIKIPLGLLRQIIEGDDPAALIGEHLGQQSNLTALRDRLLEYLYRENREGAIIEAVCRFLSARAWTYARPLETKLEMARDNPRLEDLKRQRDRLSRELSENKIVAQKVLETFQAMSAGGSAGGATHVGYEARADEQLGAQAVQEQVLEPLHAWIANDDNLKTAKKSGFDPLTTELEGALDAFVGTVHTALGTAVDAAEREALEKMGRVVAALERPHPVDLPAVRGSVGAVRASMAGSYLAFTGVGAALGACAGAAASVALTIWAGLDLDSMVHEALAASGLEVADVAVSVGAVACTAAGVLLGAVVGWAARAATAKNALKDKLRRTLDGKVRQILSSGTSGPGAERVRSVQEQLRENLGNRRAEFKGYVEAAFEKNVADLSSEIAAVAQEAERLQKELEAVIARLEPKVEALAAMGQKAQEVAEANAPAVVV